MYYNPYGNYSNYTNPSNNQNNPGNQKPQNGQMYQDGPNYPGNQSYSNGQNYPGTPIPPNHPNYTVSQNYLNTQNNTNNQNYAGNQDYNQNSNVQDYGAAPFVVDIEKAAEHNDTFRTAIWTGNHLQLTVMSIPVGGEVGLEVHPDTDQMLCVADGSGMVQMGDQKDNLYFSQPAYDNYAVFVPAGAWHNITNTGKKPLKLYTVYSPPEHPWGTVHQTKADADAAEEHYY